MLRKLDSRVALLLTVLFAASHAHANAPSPAPVCKPQGFLKLAPPFGPPRNTGGLAFCREYEACSCCEHLHSGLIYNSLKPALLDTGFSVQCKSYLSRLTCRVCDPLVGTGQRPAVCRSFCDGFHQACADEYFAFHPTSGGLVPCTAEGQQALVCSRASELAASGRDLCSAAGYVVSNDTSHCWSGAGEAAVLDSCKAQQPQRPSEAATATAAAAAKRKADAAKKKNEKKARKKAKARSKGAAGAGYSTADILLLGLVGAVSVWAGWRLLTSGAPSGGAGFSDDDCFPGSGQKLGSADRTAKHKH